MITIDIHAAESAVLHLAGIIEDRAARSGGQYDTDLDELEREFAELRWQLGHA